MKKKLMGIVVVTVLFLLIFTIFLINVINKEEYTKFTNQIENTSFVNKIGYIHSKKDIEEQNREFENYLKEKIIKTKKTIQLDTKKFIKVNKETYDKIKKDYEEGKLSLVDINKYVNTVAVLDDLSYIVTKDGYKPSKTNDKIKENVKKIDTYSTRAYDEALVSMNKTNKTYAELEKEAKESGEKISNELKKDYTDWRKELVTFVKGIDLTKGLSDENLQKLMNFNFSEDTVKSIDELRTSIEKQINSINKEVKSIKDKATKKESSANSSTQTTSSSNYSLGAEASVQSSSDLYSNSPSNGNEVSSGPSSGNSGTTDEGNLGNKNDSCASSFGNGYTFDPSLGACVMPPMSAADCAANLNATYKAHGWIIDGQSYTSGDPYHGYLDGNGGDIPKKTDPIYCGNISNVASGINNGQQRYGHAVVVDNGDYWHINFNATKSVDINYAPTTQNSEKKRIKLHNEIRKN